LRIALLQTGWQFSVLDTGALPHFERPDEFDAA
jgi:hypothetical protein